MFPSRSNAQARVRGHGDAEVPAGGHAGQRGAADKHWFLCVASSCFHLPQTRRLESVAMVMQNCLLEDMLDNEEQLTEQLDALPYLVLICDCKVATHVPKKEELLRSEDLPRGGGGGGAAQINKL
eukprot:1159718-Pelagomonas_calceolata.AAC.2